VLVRENDLALQFAPSLFLTLALNVAAPPGVEPTSFGVIVTVGGLTSQVGTWEVTSMVAPELPMLETVIDTPLVRSEKVCPSVNDWSNHVWL
jgi:hypothetical protein